ncbi:MAG: hypothetical protein ACFB4I_25140 [Cyanophyceae cyanobacterium]
MFSLCCHLTTLPPQQLKNKAASTEVAGASDYLASADRQAPGPREATEAKKLSCAAVAKV